MARHTNAVPSASGLCGCEVNDIFAHPNRGGFSFLPTPAMAQRMTIGEVARHAPLAPLYAVSLTAQTP